MGNNSDSYFEQPVSKEIVSKELFVIDYSAGFFNGCAKCRTIFKESNFAIGLFQDTKNGVEVFVLCYGDVDDVPICCDEKKLSAMRLFDTREEAENFFPSVLEKIKLGQTNTLVWVQCVHQNKIN